MKEIEFSVMYHNDQSTAALQNLLNEFEGATRIHVNLRVLDWSDAWTELIKVALYKQGPDVSEIGSSWLGDFARMLALYNFSSVDVRSFGGSESFLPANWSSASQLEANESWGIPWVADTRVIIYRRDILHQAGIDEQAAFQSHASLVETLEKLQLSGISQSWTVPTHRSRMTLHNIASWVWGAGGSFLSPDGKRTNFASPASLQGLTEYFSLSRFMDTLNKDLNDTQSDALYATGKAAVTISGTWLLTDQTSDPHVLANTGFASPPGVPFVGGSHLVLWRHTPHLSSALELIRYLSQPDIQTAYCKAIGLLPTRLDALASPAYHEHPSYHRLVDRLKSGRSFRTLPLWGMVEDKLTASLSQVWIDLMNDPSLDISQTVSLIIQPLSRRLNIALSGQ
jgi:multiple sugar transport system substrate-binding protein